jgi:hypothetical protein
MGSKCVVQNQKEKENKRGLNKSIDDKGRRESSTERNIRKKEITTFQSAAPSHLVYSTE